MSLPFHMIETINEIHGRREAKEVPQVTCFDIYRLVEDARVFIPRITNTSSASE
jgi:hypothetical protein